MRKLRCLSLSHHQCRTVVERTPNSGRANGRRYPAERMRHLLAVMGGAIARSAQQRLRALGSLWEAPFAEARAELAQGVLRSLLSPKVSCLTRRFPGAALCDRWCDASTELTTSRTSEGDVRSWDGKPYRDNFAAGLSARLGDILDLRATDEELSRLRPRSVPVLGTCLTDDHFVRIVGSLGPFACRQSIQVAR